MHGVPDNNIGGDGASAIAEVLKMNSTITLVDLGGSSAIDSSDFSINFTRIRA